VYGTNELRRKPKTFKSVIQSNTPEHGLLGTGPEPVQAEAIEKEKSGKKQLLLKRRSTSSEKKPRRMWANRNTNHTQRTHHNRFRACGVIIF